MQPGQGLEELGFKLTSLFGGDGLPLTKVGYPAGQYNTCHGVGSDVRDGIDFWPACE
jgi:hypothetical protein